MQTDGGSSVLVVAVLAPIVLLPAPLQAHDGADFSLPRISCSELAQLRWPGTEVTSTDLVPAQGPAPEYCRVRATIAPQTDIEVRLPTSWRNRLLHLGGAGFDGQIPNMDLNSAQLQQGYALAGSNGGHRASSLLDASFALDSTLTQLYAHTTIETTVTLAKALVKAYFGREPRYTYFAGCSNGGRGAFNAAAKYSHEYDGVVAAAPTRNLPGLVSAWIRNAILPFPGPAKLTSLYQAVVMTCDGLDGLADGTISNPDACQFDPATIRCPGGTDNDSCLTDLEIAAVEQFYADLRLSNGTIIYSRFGFGNAAPLLPFHALVGVAHMQYIVLQDPTWNPATFDLDTDFRTIVEVLEGTYDFSADTKPLAKYLKSGKKMIVWHGTDDTLGSHYDTIRTYEMMANAAGPGARNARLYTPAGVGHCGGGPGADTFDMITVITDWVENGNAPGKLLAFKTDRSGQLLFTRPLCEYPKYPRYVGIGDPDDAANFRCILPEPR